MFLHIVNPIYFTLMLRNNDWEVLFCGWPNCLYITVIDIDRWAHAVKNIAPIYVNNKNKINGFRQTRTNVAQTRSNICLHTSKWWWDIIYKVMVCAYFLYCTCMCNIINDALQHLVWWLLLLQQVEAITTYRSIVVWYWKCLLWMKINFSSGIFLSIRIRYKSIIPFQITFYTQCYAHVYSFYKSCCKLQFGGSKLWLTTSKKFGCNVCILMEIFKYSFCHFRNKSSN